MKVHREVHFWSGKLDELALLSALQAFSTSNARWAFEPEKSAEYTKWVNCPSCVVLEKGKRTAAAAVCVTTARPGRFYVANIVPLEAGKLSIDEYNDVAAKFSTDLASYCRETKTPIRIKTTSAEVGFDDILTASIPQKYWKRFIGAHPRSYHPNDIERLDKFICALATYARRPLNLDGFQHLLIEQLGWSEVDARWCRTRVETGLEVIAVYKNF